ncbi:hypothetical protein GOP47_0009960 [Adiantum capillus-veneris]|uniref:Uncharacterized protein n=1 Tax=Adiantum capillus-veneris TaxID=13818 RepID=A0A9D4UXT5_ADICA|nr:hypothetical protein GOP47_0009960 [Adiantum capillus-veneris]
MTTCNGLACCDHGGFLSSCLQCSQGLQQRPYHRNCNCSLHDSLGEDVGPLMKRCSSRVSLHAGISPGSSSSMSKKLARRNSGDLNGESNMASWSAVSAGSPDLSASRKASSFNDLCALMSAHDESVVQRRLSPGPSCNCDVGGEGRSASLSDLSNAQYALPPKGKHRLDFSND